MIRQLEAIFQGGVLPVFLSGAFALIVAGFVVGDFSTASRERFIVKAASSLPSPQSVPVSKLTTSVGDDLQPIWSPDGSTIAFLSNRRLGGNYRDLYRINPNGSNEQMVLQGSSTDNGWLFHPWWVGTASDLLILDAIWWDVNRFRLASAAAANALPVSLGNASFFTYLFHVNGNDLAASFVTSPDASKLALETVQNPYGSRTHTYRVYSGGLSSDLGYSNTLGMQVYQTTGHGRVGFERTIAWSPDGTKLCISACAPEAGCAEAVPRRDLFIIDIATGASQRITTTGGQGQDNTDVAWSSLNTIAFAVRVNDSSKYDLYTIQPDGTKPTRLTNNLWNETNPSWSPDGSRLVFASDQDGGYDLYVTNLTPPTVSFVQPINQSEIRKLGVGFMTKRAPTHLGQDYWAKEGTEVKAISSATVVSFFPSVGGFRAWCPMDLRKPGNYLPGPALWLRHRLSDGRFFYVLYGHMQPSQKVLDIVNGTLPSATTINAGDKIGTVAPFTYCPLSSNIEIPHLHFGVWLKDALPKNPWGYDFQPRNFTEPVSFLKNSKPF